MLAKDAVDKFDKLDNLTRTVSERSRLSSSAEEPAAASAVPDVYEARQTAGARHGRPAESVPGTLAALAVGALVGLLAGFWFFRKRE